MQYVKYSDKDLKEILKSVVFVVDTRENVNGHITEYFNLKKVMHKSEKLDTGDYSVMIPKNVEYGIMNDTYLKVVVERKNSIDELASSIKEDRFENELIRSMDTRMVLMVEDKLENLQLGNYRSQYNKDALMARLKSFEARYGFTTVFLEKASAGDYIYKHLYYFARAYLKGYLRSV